MILRYIDGTPFGCFELARFTPHQGRNGATEGVSTSCVATSLITKTLGTITNCLSQTTHASCHKLRDTPQPTQKLSTAAIYHKRLNTKSMSQTVCYDHKTAVL